MEIIVTDRYTYCHVKVQDDSLHYQYIEETYMGQICNNIIIKDNKEVCEQSVEDIADKYRDMSPYELAFCKEFWYDSGLFQSDTIYFYKLICASSTKSAQ